MNQEIIQNFLNIILVLGVALIDERSQLYFYVKEQALDWKGKQALKQSILQVIVKTPERSEFFEFQVMGYYAHAYTLNPNLTFLFFTRTDVSANKLLALSAKQLKAAMQRDIDSTVTTFKLLPVEATVEELLKALNQLSQFSSNYLGTQLTTNYWQLTRPSLVWLDNFEINRSAEITFSSVITEPVSALQHQHVKEWAAAFIKRCSQIVKDLPTIIEQKGLDELNKRLLLTPPAS